MIVGTEHGDGRAGLCQAVGVDEVDVGQQLHGPLDELDRHAPTAVGEVAQRGQVDAFVLALPTVALALAHTAAMTGNADSFDRGGCVNLLSPSRYTSKNACGEANMSYLVEVRKWEA